MMDNWFGLSQVTGYITANRHVPSFTIILLRKPTQLPIPHVIDYDK